MKKVKNVLVLVLTTAALSLVGVGCESQSKDEHPAADHPTKDHSESDHPKSEHPG